jgi:hypothetical protein
MACFAADSESVTSRLCRVAGQPGEHVSIFRCLNGDCADKFPDSIVANQATLMKHRPSCGSTASMPGCSVQYVQDMKDEERVDTGT